MEYALSRGWSLRKQGHWGRLYRAQANRHGYQIGVNGTRETPTPMRARSSVPSNAAPVTRTALAMKTFEFTIVASGLNPEDEDFESRFYDAGCDDATISFQRGHVIVDFTREAESVDAAITSAVEAVRSVGATVDRIEPDPLVSLADIAAPSQRTRAAMTLTQRGSVAKAFRRPSPRSHPRALVGLGQRRFLAVQA